MPPKKVTGAVTAAILNDETERNERSVSAITDNAVIGFLRENTPPEYDVSGVSDDETTFGAQFEQTMHMTHLAYQVYLSGSLNRKTVSLVLQYMLDALLGLGAWVEGKAASPPSVRGIYGKLWAIERLSFKQDYSRDLKGGNTSDFLRTRSALFLNKYVQLIRKAEKLRQLVTGEESEVEVLVKMKVRVPTSGPQAKQYVSEVANKLFLNDDDFESQVLSIELAGESAPVTPPTKKKIVIIRKKAP